MRYDLERAKNELLTMGLNGEKVFGEYDVKPAEKNSDVINFINYLQDSSLKEVPFLFEDEEGNNYSYDDFIFDNMPDEIEGEIEENFNRCLNSYNWSGRIVFQIRPFKYFGEDYVAIAFHKFGDVRGNYTNYSIFKCSMDDFLETAYEFNIEIPSENWVINQNLFDECCVVNAWNSETGEDFQGYYGSEEAPEEVKNAVADWM